MSSNTYTGAILGCGHVADFQLPAWRRVDGVEIVAAYNRTREKAERRASQYGIPRVYDDYRELLDTEKLDFVDIATPPPVHLEMVSEAAKRGIPVLCQKPIAATLGELRTMIARCEEAGVPFMVNENCRFQPWFRRMRRLIDDGTIGRLTYVNFTSRARITLPRMDVNRPQAALFTGMPRLVLFELGVHYLDTLRYLAGEGIHVWSRTEKLSDDVAGEDTATVMVSSDSVTAIIDLSWAAVPAWQEDKTVSWGECRVEGTEGTLHLRVDGLLRTITDKGVSTQQFPDDSEFRGYQATQQHFIDCLRRGTEPETSGRETLKTMELVLGAYDSAENERLYRVGVDVSRLG